MMSQVRLGTSRAAACRPWSSIMCAACWGCWTMWWPRPTLIARRSGTDSSDVEAHLRLLRERWARDAPCCGGTPLPSRRTCRSRWRLVRSRFDVAAGALPGSHRRPHRVRARGMQPCSIQVAGGKQHTRIEKASDTLANCRWYAPCALLECLRTASGLRSSRGQPMRGLHPENK